MLIGAYGMFWDRDEVDWASGRGVGLDRFVDDVTVPAPAGATPRPG